MLMLAVRIIKVRGNIDSMCSSSTGTALNCSDSYLFSMLCFAKLLLKSLKMIMLNSYTCPFNISLLLGKLYDNIAILKIIKNKMKN